MRKDPPFYHHPKSHTVHERIKSFLRVIIVQLAAAKQPNFSTHRNTFSLEWMFVVISGINLEKRGGGETIFRHICDMVNLRCQKSQRTKDLHSAGMPTIEKMNSNFRSPFLKLRL